MTNIQLKAVSKAVSKGLKNGLGLDGIMSLVVTYEDLLSDESDDGLSSAVMPDPGPPPIIISPSIPAPSIRKLSVTTSMSTESASFGRSLYDMFEELQRTAAETPTVSFTNPGFNRPVRYNVEPYKNENSRICGINFSVDGDRSIVASRTSYSEGSEFDVSKDIEEFIASQQQIYKSRSSPVVATVPRPIGFSEALSNIERVGDYAGSVS